MRTRHSFPIAVVALTLPLKLALADPTGPLTLSRPDDALGPMHEPAVRGLDDSESGYVVEEFFIAGEATVYNYRTNPPKRGDIVPIEDQTNLPYQTRLIVRRPAEPEDFNGTVVIEWWNSTAGFDTAPVWDPSHEYFTRKGIVYIGWTNSNQSISFLVNNCNPIPEFAFLNSCGPIYESLFLTDNGQAYEIGSQIANALKNGPNSPLPDEYEVERVFHAGQSQQGGSMVTYASAFHLEGVNDGYFVQAAGTARDINAGTECDDPEAAPFPDCTPELEGKQRLVRTNLPVPVYRAHTESDMPRVISGETRQKDTKTFTCSSSFEPLRL